MCVKCLNVCFEPQKNVNCKFRDVKIKPDKSNTFICGCGYYFSLGGA